MDQASYVKGWDGGSRVASEAAAAEIERLRAALRDVLNPFEVLRRKAKADGARLNGMAYQIANSLSFVQTIARDALAMDEQNQTERK